MSRALLVFLLVVDVSGCGRRARRTGGDDDDDTTSDGDADADADSDVDGDADVDADADSDADSDVDADSDADADTDADGDLDVTAETCNGRDDDQDGRVDEDNPEGGDACSTGRSGRCAAGRTLCQNGELVCDPDHDPVNETCANMGADDDCDGSMDDITSLFTECDTGLVGQCWTGTWQCDGNSLSCTATQLDVNSEICENLVDDDCDGSADEFDCVTGGTFTHHDGLGHTWTDEIPTGTYSLAQANQACQSYVAALGLFDSCISDVCGCSGGAVECVYNSGSGGTINTWFFAGTYQSYVTLNTCGFSQTTWD